MSNSLIKLSRSKLKSGIDIQITGSKSESNRALILQALYSGIELQNLSNSDDTQLLVKALTNNSDVVDIHHAGTAMRFLTAYFSVLVKSEVTLTGSNRMKERPIQVLVDALTSLGAQIEYLGNSGFPPIRIVGRDLINNEVELRANVSSQYISALLLIAPSLKNGLLLHLVGDITSRPYIEMTLALLTKIGVEVEFEGQLITVKPLEQLEARKLLTIESDWSSASYFYSLIALSEVDTEVHLSHYFSNSLQGDSVLQEVYKHFGVETGFTDSGITLNKKSKPKSTHIDLNLVNAPDIAQTIVVTCFGLNMGCYLSGLHTLKIKETDRLVALKNELSKLGANISITNNSLKLETSSMFITNQTIETYNDHRMAMAFAPLALKGDININDKDVVSKSYPDFWRDLSLLGIQMK